MTLQEIIEALTTSEFSQLSFGGEAQGVINESNAPKLVPHLNLGLTTLYARFNLKEGRLVLEPVADQTVYAIHSKYAVNNTRSRELVRYLIDDPAAPFKDDVLRIERVLTDAGDDLPMNVDGNTWSAHTPTATSLRLPLEVVNQTQDLPDWLKTEQLELVYRANHPKLAVDVDLDADVIQLPYSHLSALLYFTASRANWPTGMNIQSNLGDPWMQKYERACQALENQGLQRQAETGFDKLRDRGFV